eukprot:3935126-Rhodomonas_salina.1
MDAMLSSMTATLLFVAATLSFTATPLLSMATTLLFMAATLANMSATLPFMATPPPLMGAALRVCYFGGQDQRLSEMQTQLHQVSPTEIKAFLGQAQYKLCQGCVLLCLISSRVPTRKSAYGSVVLRWLSATESVVLRQVSATESAVLTGGTGWDYQSLSELEIAKSELARIQVQPTCFAAKSKAFSWNCGGIKGFSLELQWNQRLFSWNCGGIKGFLAGTAVESKALSWN